MLPLKAVVSLNTQHAGTEPTGRTSASTSPSEGMQSQLGSASRLAISSLGNTGGR